MSARKKSAKAKAGVARVTSELANLQVGPAPSNAVSFVARPKDVAASSAMVLTNYFKVTQLDCKKVHHYDITFTPEVRKPTIKRVWAHLLSTKPNVVSGMAFDGRKNVYSAKELNPSPLKITVDLPPRNAAPKGGSAKKKGKSVDKKSSFTIELKKVATIDMTLLNGYIQGKLKLDASILVGIQALEVIFGTSAWLRHLSVGRRYFATDCGKTPLPKGLLLYSGLFMSARACQAGLMLNVNLAHTAFYASIPVAEYLSLNVRGFRVGQKLSDAVFREADREMRKKKITINYGPRTRNYGTLKLINKKPEEIVFEYQKPGDTGKPRKIDVRAYYAERYGIRLQQGLPCIDVGDKDRATYVPMELAVIAKDQKYPGKLNDEQLRETLKVAAKPPSELKTGIIQRYGQMADFGSSDNALMKEFGIKVSADFMTVKAQRMPAPQLQYSGQQRVTVTGSGTWENERGKFFCPAEIANGIGVINASRMPDNSITQFVEDVKKCLQARGVTFPNYSVHVTKLANFRENDVCQAYTAIQKAKALGSGIRVGLVMFVFEGRDSLLYDVVKRACYTMLGVPSQCLLRRNLEGRNMAAYMSNLALKINAKVASEAVNWKLTDGIKNTTKFFDSSVMILGADVTHPPPGIEDSSIAAVVASYGSAVMRYNSLVSAQKARQEVITNLKDIVVTLLKRHYFKCEAYPKRLLFFRDGVGEGQLQIILDNEVAAVRQAGVELGLQFQLTYIVVSKRNQTRFFGTDQCVDRKSQNLYPGFAVSEGITSPLDFDFYLQSQAGLKGTSRPSYYQVLCDDFGFKSVELMSVVFALCHMYVRCTRSVKIPAPVYYAHHLCYRARHMTALKSGPEQIKCQDSEEEGSLGVSGVTPLAALAGGLDKTMYFV